MFNLYDNIKCIYMNLKFTLISIALLTVNISLKAQSVSCDSLYSPCTNTISTNGFFIDLRPVNNNVLIEYFSTMSQNPGLRDVEIYWKSGSYVGFETDPNAWTLIGSTTGFNPDTTISCPMNTSRIPIQVNKCIPVGQKSSFYIMKVNGSGSFEVNNDDSAGTIIANDGELRMFAGKIASGYVAFDSFGQHDDHSFQGAVKYSCGCSLTGLNENFIRNGLHLSPVPATDLLNIEIENSDIQFSTIQILDVTGRVVKDNIDISEKVSSVKINDLNNGIYLVRAISSNRIIAESKFVKL